MTRWQATRWIVRERDYGMFLDVAVEIRDDVSGEERRNAAETRSGPTEGKRDEAEQRCRAKLQEWIDAMNAGTATDLGLPLHTQDVLEGREMRA